MTTKKKQNSKVPKSAKTRLSDIEPKKDARGGQLPVVGGGPQPTPPIYNPPPSASATGKQQPTL
jgi:hypothetical protein